MLWFYKEGVFYRDQGKNWKLTFFCGNWFVHVGKKKSTQVGFGTCL